MKRLFVLLFCVAAAAAAADDSPLVKAAKANGGPKRKTTKKVITNRDVKKSKGKLAELPTKPDPVPVPAGPVKGSLQKQDDQRRAQAVTLQRVATAQTKVNDLEKELLRLEQAYYEAADPNYRDTQIQDRFNQTKRQLEDARKELADARDADQRAAGKSR
jgi:hypothetical protein